MQLPAPARECSDAELQEVYDFYARRAVQPLEPQPFIEQQERYEDWQAQVDYSRHTAECAPDDEPEDKCEPGEGGGIAVPMVIVVILAAIAATWHLVARLLA